MTATNTARPAGQAADLGVIALCALIWGTTWYAITLQLGVVDPIVSIVYRFGLAATLLFGWCVLRRERLGLNRAQHAAALGVGLFTFAIDYAFVYFAEERVASAVVAVMFASMAFMNMIIFRIVFAQRATLTAWGGAGLGIVGVAMLSWEEMVTAEFGAAAITGIVLTLFAVLAAAIGNVFARRAELVGAPVAALTGWAMLYGALILTMVALITGKTWAFEWTPAYVLSLVHLSLNGSVIAFVLYYGLARRRGYGLASYISALTPPVAMLMSSLFEAKTWGLLALSGVGLVLAGQWLLLRTRSA